MTATRSAAGIGADPAPLDLEQLRERVDDVLITFLKRQRLTLADVDPSAASLLDSISDLLTGGKRLRPAFCYWGWRGSGRVGTDAAVVAAAALELFQAAALIHDDVIDDSNTRRGRATVHRVFSGRHRHGTGGTAWLGNSDRFGMSAALLAGDLCLTWSSELLTAAVSEEETVRPEHGRAARATYDTMCTQLMAGQYLDVLEQAEALGTVERALHVIRFKSAKYTVEHPLLMGGRLAGAEPATLQTYSNYAVPLGEAFQLRDDLLGVFGNSEQTGKPNDEDLKEGKRTVLVAIATQSANTAQREVLARVLGNHEASDEDMTQVREILTETGASSQVERMIARRVTQATSALAAGVIDDQARKVLDALILATTRRTS